MTDSTFWRVGLMHGCLGGAVLLLLAVTAWWELRGQLRAFGAGVLICSALQWVQAAAGLLLATHYEGRLRRLLFLRSPSLGWWLERKEHLAIGAVALTWCALAAHRAGSRAASGQDAGYRRAARAATLSAALLSFMSFVIGVLVGAGMTSELR